MGVSGALAGLWRFIGSGAGVPGYRGGGSVGGGVVWAWAGHWRFIGSGAGVPGYRGFKSSVAFVVDDVFMV